MASNCKVVALLLLFSISIQLWVSNCQDLYDQLRLEPFEFEPQFKELRRRVPEDSIWNLKRKFFLDHFPPRKRVLGRSRKP